MNPGLVIDDPPGTAGGHPEIRAQEHPGDRQRHPQSRASTRAPTPGHRSPRPTSSTRCSRTPCGCSPGSPPRCGCTVPRWTMWCPTRACVALRRGLTHAPLEVIRLENSYHVATMDNDAPEIFRGSAEFIRSLVAARRARTPPTPARRTRQMTRPDSNSPPDSERQPGRRRLAGPGREAGRPGHGARPPGPRAAEDGKDDAGRTTGGDPDAPGTDAPGDADGSAAPRPFQRLRPAGPLRRGRRLNSPPRSGRRRAGRPGAPRPAPPRGSARGRRRAAGLRGRGRRPLARASSCRRNRPASPAPTR